MSQISGNLKYNELDVKRFYLKGLILNTQCPHCLHTFSVSLSEHYPYSFKENGECQLSYLCEKCEEAINHTMQLEVKLTPKEKPQKG